MKKIGAVAAGILAAFGTTILLNVLNCVAFSITYVDLTQEYKTLVAIDVALGLLMGYFVIDVLVPKQAGSSKPSYNHMDRVTVRVDGIDHHAWVLDHKDNHVKVKLIATDSVVILHENHILAPFPMSIEEDRGRLEAAKIYYADCVRAQRYELAAALKPYINQAENALDLFYKTADEGPQE